jgi:hypothetical protein
VPDGASRSISARSAGSLTPASESNSINTPRLWVRG